MDIAKGVLALLVLIVAVAGVHVLQSPFSYPYFSHEFDVSGKRNPQIEDLLDTFLISGGFDEIKIHQERIMAWKADCFRRIDRSLLRRYRRKQYRVILDDAAAFQFHLVRQKTRYMQQNYVKIPYKVSTRVSSFVYSYAWIKSRHNELSGIGFECTLRAYHSKNQRKLATRSLREKIMRRDGYMCQICGKYMPDEVGLQVDHIIPVSKGGKTVESNLRVLCSKCNGAKSNKM